MAIVFVFLDGLGLGEANEHNPLWAYSTPFLQHLFGAPLVQGIGIRTGRLIAHGINAGLGVPGAPQSATGQTALFTGANAPAMMGRHLAAYPGPLLRRVIREHSLLKRAIERGHTASFANAYSETYWKLVAGRKLRHSASTLTTLAAELPLRDFDDLAAGKAVYWDITHSTTGLRRGQRLPYRHPQEAGRVLGELTNEHDLVLFETFLTDLVGHRRLPHTPRWTVYVIDAFLQGVMGRLGVTHTLVVSSDHGNFEDMRTRTHTENEVPLLVAGPAAEHFSSINTIADVAPAILDALGGPEPGTRHLRQYG